MLNEEIKTFAIKHGFNDIKEIGNYKDFKVYLPIFTTNKKIVGYPQYILLKDEEINLKIDITMEITKSLFPEMEC